MKKILLFLVTAVVLFSCDDELDYKELLIKDFTISIPSNWTFKELQGIDSYVSRIEINEQEVINIDLGWYSNSLNVDNSSHDIIFKSIDSKGAKVVRPKKFKLGTTGVYFDSLDTQGTRLQMHGIDLTRSNQLLFLMAIGTIKFN